MTRVAAIVVALGACRAPVAPAPVTATAVIDAPTADAPPAVIGRDELVHRLQALGARSGAGLAAASPPFDPADLAAFGSCTRPSPAERAALRVTILGWIDHSSADEVVPVTNDELRFGCVDRTGVVVDVHVDRERKAPKPGQMHLVGHWWTLRVAGDAVSVLASVSGYASADFQEWMAERTVETVALADLDRDGSLDVLSAETLREGGDNDGEIALSVIPAATGHGVPIATFDATLELARGQPRDRSGPVVVTISDHAERAYRCVEGAALATCPDAAGARRFDEAVDAAESLARVQVETLPDRDELAGQLALLAPPAAERAQLLAAVDEPSSATRATRAVERFRAARAGAGSDRTSSERQHADETERARRHETVRAALGDGACATASPPPAIAKQLDAWVRANDVAQLSKHGGCKTGLNCGLRPPSHVAIVGHCLGPDTAYVAADWAYPKRGGEELARRGVFFLAHGKPALVIDASIVRQEAFGGGAGPPVGTGLEPLFYRHGDALIAMVVTGDHRITGVVDGRVVGTQTVEVLPERARDGELVFDDLVAASDGDHMVYWHVAATLAPAATIPVPDLAGPAAGGDALATLLGDVERHRLADELVAGFDGTQLAVPGMRADLSRALAILGAEPSLVALVANAQ